MRKYDLIIVGAGASGILCAIEASKKGINNILVIEKDPVIGGALTTGDYNISKDNNITGKEYRDKLLKELKNHNNIDMKLSTMVLKIKENNEVLCMSSEDGVEKIQGKSIILCNGAKEGSRKAVSMVGDRCSGIFTVGMSKKIMNMENVIIGKNVFIYGNDTLYMIEKDLKKHDINVVGIITQSDKDTFNLTNNLYDGYEIIYINGSGRIKSVTLKNNDKEINIDCDTLIFSLPMLSDGVVAMRSNIKLNSSTTGPIVDDEFMTSRENIYACGNGIYIHNDIEEIENECIRLIQNIIK